MTPVLPELLNVNVPGTVNVAPDAMITTDELALENVTALRVCEPLIVNPDEKITVEAPALIVPAEYVQLLPVRIVPLRFNVPVELIVIFGKSPAEEVAL